MGVANAFATLWWNIILTTELLEELEYEEELLFIIWHEAEHIEKRHVLTWLLTNIPFKMTLVLLGFEFDTSFISKKTTQFFDKNLETKADQWGIDFLNEINLNLECALGFFSRESPSLFNSYFEFDSSHPITQNRIKHIQQAAEISANYQDCHTLVYE
jgi:predicted Zn-dependent protease